MSEHQHGRIPDEVGTSLDEQDIPSPIAQRGTDQGSVGEEAGTVLIEQGQPNRRRTPRPAGDGTDDGTRRRISSTWPRFSAALVRGRVSHTRALNQVVPGILADVRQAISPWRAIATRNRRPESCRARTKRKAGTSPPRIESATPSAAPSQSMPSMSGRPMRAISGR
jgi:hypothetical protein